MVLDHEAGQVGVSVSVSARLCSGLDIDMVLDARGRLFSLTLMYHIWRVT